MKNLWIAIITIFWASPLFAHVTNEDRARNEIQTQGIRDALVHSFKKGNGKAVRKHTVPLPTIVMVNGTTSQGPDAVDRFFEQFAPDEPGEAGNAANVVANGKEAKFESVSILDDGKKAEFAGTLPDRRRWTAVASKHDKQWLIERLHVDATAPPATSESNVWLYVGAVALVFILLAVIGTWIHKSQSTSAQNPASGRFGAVH